jgi:predicted metal-dependent phosphoesterase TrpH
MSFLYDLHVHTSRYSSCSHSAPESMCREAIKMGLSGIGLTEHDKWWPTSELERLRMAFPDLTIFRGIECSNAEGHFLVFLPEDTSVEEIGSGTLRRLAPKVRDLGGIVIWAHPFRYDRSIPSWLGDVPLDGIEVASTNMDEKANDLSLDVARNHGIVELENSDAHDTNSIGVYRNAFSCRLKDNDELIEYVRNVH